MVILALGIRGAYQLERRFEPSRYDLAYGMDEYNYDRLAASRVAGRFFFPGVIYSLPGYPALLHPLYLIGGRSLDLVRAAQALLGAISCGLTFLLGRKVFGPKAGLLAALIAIFYGPSLFFETRLVPATAGLLASLLSLTWLAYLPGANRRPAWLMGGVLLGVAALFAAGNLLLALLILLFWIPGNSVPPLSLIWKETLVLLGVLLVLTPAATRNSRQAGAPVALTAHAGINFFIGNNPESTGGFKTPLFLTPSATGIILDSHRVAEERAGKRLSPGGSSWFWFKEGLRYLFSAPGNTLRLTMLKIGLLIGPREYPDIGGNREGAKRDFQLYGIPLVPFGLIVPFAAAGLFLSPRRKRTRMLLLLYLIAGVSAIVFFYYQDRARLLIVPVCAIFAGGCVQFLFRALRDRQLKRAFPVIIFLFAAFVALWNLPAVEMRSETNLLMTRAQKNFRERNMSVARDMLDRALLLHPGLGGAYLVLGDVASLEGNEPAAEEYYRVAEQKEPLNPDPALRLSILFLGRGKLNAAKGAALRALTIDPLSWKAHSLLADSYYYSGEEEEAYRQARIAVQLNPNSAKDHNNLALHFSREGDPGMAEYHYRRAARIGGWTTEEEDAPK